MNSIEEVKNLKAEIYDLSKQLSHLSKMMEFVAQKTGARTEEELVKAIDEAFPEKEEISEE